jgi:hypothetical protein
MLNEKDIQSPWFDLIEIVDLFFFIVLFFDFHPIKTIGFLHTGRGHI